ncbi:ABC-type maltose transport system, permease component [Halalkaliarchaeum sp. AArc-CO]|uniref:sugar ABC transporter permease n=1 Tax=Halalkaliarchaeum sp. AArc-CO TaxID=2866381 RepID=UPI00217D1D84|nr:ABC transporter permease subunit [Halalkaliarchaeum sp. AArc-CO]UWG49827.1 ABC-type maltose transport system, permease component [Halalkaliarchaeum sp. AArc-CO]
MTLLDAIGRKLKSDLRSIPMAVVGWVRNSRYKLDLYRRGKIGLFELLAPVGASVFGLVLVAALLFPIYWIAMAALSGTGASLYSAEGFRLFPEDPTLQAFVWVIGDVVIPSLRISIPFAGVSLVTSEIVLLDAAAHGVDSPSDFPRYAWNSLTVAIPTVIMAMAVIVPGAYALSRREFLMRKKVLYGYILFTQVGGGLGIAMLVALYAIFVSIGVTNSKLALATYYAAMAVPFNTWLLKTFMDSIPPSYEEAAAVDGAPPWRIVWEVILPLSKAGLAAVFIFVFLAGWMEFIVAQTVLRPENYTLPVGLFALIDEYSVPWARFSAFALSFAAPIMFIYLFAQRYIESGLSFGGMEG